MTRTDRVMPNMAPASAPVKKAPMPMLAPLGGTAALSPRGAGAAAAPPPPSPPAPPGGSPRNPTLAPLPPQARAGMDDGTGSHRPQQLRPLGDVGHQRLAPLPAPPALGGIGGASSSSSASRSLTSDLRAAADNSFYAKASTRTQEAYRKLAQDRCAEALANAAEVTKKKSRRKLPPGVWWGFHWFWPEHLLKERETMSPMEDPEFLKKVFRLMNDERIVDTFALFDSDASGSISSKELDGLISMIIPNPRPTVVKEIAAELDLNADGEIDLWEFCVHLQKISEGVTRTDLDMEMDEAFALFEPDDDGAIDEVELRRWFQESSSGCPLTEEEVVSLIGEVDTFFNLRPPLRSGGRIKLADLRRHPCFSSGTGVTVAQE